jgi:hypothetical protein
VSSPPREPSTLPRKAELLDAIDTHVTGLDSMIGRWFDAIPAAVRAELRRLREPLETLLIRAKRRGQLREPKS